MTLDDYENNADQEQSMQAEPNQTPAPAQAPAQAVPTYQEIQAYAQLEAEKQIAISEFRRNHPELSAHERYIQQDAEAYAMEELQKGNYVTPAQALLKGAERFTATLPKPAKQKEPEDDSPIYQMLETGNEGNRMSSDQRATKIATMSAADFRKLSEAMTAY